MFSPGWEIRQRSVSNDGLRTVEGTIYQCIKDGEVYSFSGDSGGAKILNSRDRRSLKRLLKANRQKSV